MKRSFVSQMGQALSLAAALQISAGCAAHAQVRSKTPVVVPTVERVKTVLEVTAAACEVYRSTGVYNDGRQGERLAYGVTAVLLAGGSAAMTLRAMMAPKKERLPYVAVAMMLLLVAEASAVSSFPPDPAKLCATFPPFSQP